jgi:hypothetical protein
MKKINNFSNAISEVLHRTQQERGAGSGYLGKPSKEFKKLYLKKIKLTDKAIHRFMIASRNCSKIPIQNVKIYINNLERMRKEVLNNEISLEKEINFYNLITTKINMLNQVVLEMSELNNKIIENLQHFLWI